MQINLQFKIQGIKSHDQQQQQPDCDFLRGIILRVCRQKWNNSCYCNELQERISNGTWMPCNPEAV